jgi:5'-deoxynucleotidase YfbR-like HD superfamily hydrolase
MSQVLDRFGCLNNTIKVSAGHYVDLANPDPSTIEVKSIAAALSKVCRFGGHCPQFYSVAEHCIHATALACSEGYTGDALIAVFLHDAAEAYIGDMVKPLKVTMPQYGEAEQRIEAAIQAAFGVDFSKWMDVIKRFDRAMLKAEKVTMWPEDTENWAGFSEIEDRVVKFQFWEPSQAEMQFLAMARTLQLVG